MDWDSTTAHDLGFCSLRRQVDCVLQDAEEFPRPLRVERQ